MSTCFCNIEMQGVYIRIFGFELKHWQKTMRESGLWQNMTYIKKKSMEFVMDRGCDVSKSRAFCWIAVGDHKNETHAVTGTNKNIVPVVSIIQN